MKIKFKMNPSPISSVPATAPSASQDLPQDQNGKLPKSDHPLPATTKNPSAINTSPSAMVKRENKRTQMDDEVLGDIVKLRRRSSAKSDRAGPSHGKYASGKKLNEVKTPALIRAEEFQSTLSSEFPSFIKPMIKSHVDKGFWMGIPGHFSKQHLPRSDTALILVTETGEEYALTYIEKKNGLGAGWRNFSVKENLREDDVLIFQLVEPYKFQVYLVRANEFSELDGAVNLDLNLEAQFQPENAANSEKDGEEASQKGLNLTTYKRKRTESLQTGSASLMVMDKKKRLKRSVPKSLQLANIPENGYKREKPSSSGPPNFTITNFKDFTIVVDGLCIDSDLPEDTRARYFDLCYMRNDLLHTRLGQGLNSELVAGIISETTNIFDSLTKCSVITFCNQYKSWGKTLKSFELLGMKVGFLRERLRMLTMVGFESDGALESRKYVDAIKGKRRVAKEIVNLKNKIVELREASKKYNEDIENLKFKAEVFEQKFQEAVNAPW